MIKKTVTYKDFNGNDRTDDFYFHYSTPELAEMELSVGGGLSATLEKIVNEKDQAKLIGYFKKIVIGAFGIKSQDGSEFLKDDEIRKKFECSAAYPVIFMELATDDKKAAEFVNGIIPQDVSENIADNGEKTALNVISGGSQASLPG